MKKEQQEIVYGLQYVRSRPGLFYKRVEGQKAFEEIVADLARITLMSEDDIINFVESHPIDYYDLRLFYLREARLPTDDECRCIYQIGLLEFCEMKIIFDPQKRR